MFKRLIFDHWVMVFPIAAFITAAAIYGTMMWFTARMRRSQSDRMANLPLKD